MPIRDLLQATDFFSEPMALVRRDGTIESFNRPFAEQLALPPESLQGTRLDTLAAMSAAAIEDYVRACASSQKVVKGNLLLRRRAETIALQARGIAYPPSAAPSVSQILLRLTDQKGEGSATSPEPGTASVDDWRESEAELRRQSQILEVTLASIGDAVIVTDAEGRATFLNPVAENLTGWSTQAAKGHTLAEIFPILNEYTREPAVDPVSRVLRTGTILGLANHTLLRRPDGREIPIDNSAAPIRSPSGELFGVVVVFRDVSAQRRAQHERAWLAEIVQSSHDPIVSKTLDGQITSWNQAAVRLFGYPPEEAIGQPITLIIPPELREQEAELLARLRAGERIENFETVRVTRDGRRVEVALTVSPIRDEAGYIVGASKIARDISDRKRHERALQEADRQKDEFLATLSHELRNPLGPIRSAAHVLCRVEHKDPTLRTACDIIDRQLRQLTRLIDDLLDVSRVTTGGVHLVREEVDLSALLNTMATSLQPAFSAAGQSFELSLPPEPLFTRGDRTRLMQVFANLLTNANKYTPDGGRIEVRGFREDTSVVVSIRDTGIGISDTMLEKIFDLFAQVDRSPQHTRGGLGIGLALAKRLVELHGGRIEAHSDGHGRGAEFLVRFPAADPPERQDGPATPSALPQVTRKVLIVDDNVDAAVSLSILLHGLGHDTRVAHDGVAAIELAEAFRPEVMILDIGMPGMDGYETARRIRQQPWSTATLLVALTGWGQTSDREDAASAGFHAHVVKPADLQVLQELITGRSQPTPRS
jgi:PAS domain S-box-containing protein